MVSYIQVSWVLILVFLPILELESIFAQHQSYRSFLPLQLLFWPNFELHCEIWSFCQSKLSQNLDSLGKWKADSLRVGVGQSASIRGSLVLSTKASRPLNSFSSQFLTRRRNFQPRRESPPIQFWAAWQCEADDPRVRGRRCARQRFECSNDINLNTVDLHSDVRNILNCGRSTIDTGRSTR